MMKMFLGKEQDVSSGRYKPKRQISHSKSDIRRGLLILYVVDVAVESSSFKACKAGRKLKYYNSHLLCFVAVDNTAKRCLC